MRNDSGKDSKFGRVVCESAQLKLLLRGHCEALPTAPPQQVLQDEHVTLPAPHHTANERKEDTNGMQLAGCKADQGAGRETTGEGRV